jgi:phospholipid N-methyltransferase
MDSIFPTYEFLDTCSNPWSALHQLITEPTYVTEHSSSLLDLILVSNPLSVLFTDVGAPLLEQVRYHLPVIGLLHHSSKPSTSYKRKIFLSNQSSETETKTHDVKYGNFSKVQLHYNS